MNFERLYPFSSVRVFLWMSVGFFSLFCKNPKLCSFADTSTFCGLEQTLVVQQTNMLFSSGRSSGSLASPSSLTVSAGNALNALTWNSVARANSYRIYWRNSPGVTISNGNLIPDVSSPYTHTGLTNGSTYYYILTAVSGTEESSPSLEVTATPSLPSYKMYVTTSSYLMTALNGISGADSKCNSDPGKPSGSASYKALMVDETYCGGNPCRRASISANAGDGQIDWVLRPNTQYVRADGVTPILFTNSVGLFTFGTLTNSFTTAAATGVSGMSTSWTVFGGLTCTNYTSTSGSVTTAVYNQTGSGSLSNSTQSCSSSYFLLCVEQ